MSNLKRIRQSRNLTQVKLAELSGVNLSNIKKYESGEKDINKANAFSLYQISKIIGCKIEDLLNL